MPLWKIYFPKGVFEDISERQKLSAAITKIYTDLSLPAFYVGVVFIEQPEGSMFKGGEASPSSTQPPWIRIVWTNIAGSFDPAHPERRDAFIKSIDDALWPFIGAKGWDYEHHGEDADVALGRIQGFSFPPRYSELEKFWFETNVPKALPEK